MKWIELKKEQQVARVILNRPDLHNAFNPEMILEVTEAFKELSQDSQLRSVVLSGKGKSFCAGADLEWMKSMANYSYEQNIQDSKSLYNMFDAIRNCSKPVICRVHGNVMGGGLGLVAASDIVVAEKDSRYAFSEVKLGLVPSVISSFVLKKCSDARVRELMLTAETFNSFKAREIGLVQFVGEPEEIDDHIQGKIDFIFSGGPEAVAMTKHILNYNQAHPIEAVVEETIRVIAERRVSAEGQAGLSAFLSKQPAPWKKA